jgi:hypothetical protein
LWNDLIKIESFNNGWNLDQINQISKIKDQFDQISGIKESLKGEVKVVVKDTLKEVVFEALDKMHEDELENNSSNLKMVLIGASVAFVLYFFFVLPGPDTDPGIINTYNVFNQTLINSKIYIKDLFDTVKDIHNNGPLVDPVNPIVGPVNTHPSLPGVIIDGISPASSSTVSPSTPRSSGYNVYFHEVETPTITSSSLPTVTETGTSIEVNSSTSPILPNLIDKSVQTDTIPLLNKSTETEILSVNVSKLQETSIIVQNSLPKVDRDALVKMVNENIINITD